MTTETELTANEKQTSATLRATLRNRLTAAKNALPESIHTPLPALDPGQWPKSMAGPVSTYNERRTAPTVVFEEMLAAVDMLADAVVDPSVDPAAVIDIGMASRGDFLGYLRTLQAAIVGRCHAF
jgi:hypothetical protein